ncbi:MAG: flavin reductase family protein [Marinicaulis sp.]|nr:flavin reductase family protein [Marinicaulis sp.]NNE39945.1 flavin reductase family protein [Marinicaulis sp.]NNL89350.1 flavin reductase family protein [Marinicaulis sp.]
MTDPHRPLKDALSRFATGVAVAGCKAPGDGGFAALTINSFTSVSLEPPLVLWCLENKASVYPAFMSTTSYSVNILRSDQKDLSQRFATWGQNKFTDDEIETWETGAPIMKDRLAAFDCKIHARHKAGDHVILVGEVVRFESEVATPLIYFSSNYHTG